MCKDSAKIDGTIRVSGSAVVVKSGGGPLQKDHVKIGRGSRSHWQGKPDPGLIAKNLGSNLSIMPLH